MDGLYYSYSPCEDDQTFPKAFPAAGYDKDNSAVILNSYATYSKQVSIARILGSPRVLLRHSPSYCCSPTTAKPSVTKGARPCPHYNLHQTDLPIHGGARRVRLSRGQLDSRGTAANRSRRGLWQMVRVYVSSAGLLSSSVYHAFTEPCISLCLSGTP